MTIEGSIEIELIPSGKRLELASKTSLRDVLFAEGTEFPCGGKGRCKGCRMKLLEGTLPVTPADRRLFSTEELETGWRLSCQARPESDLKLEIAQCEMAMLSDHSRFVFSPRSGFGLAIDLGSTTIVAQLLDLNSGAVLGVRTALNAQAVYGADIITRMESALADHGERLTRVIREQLGEMVADLLSSAEIDTAQVENIIIVGNTVMHHLFSGLSVEPLAHHPFEPASRSLQTFDAPSLGWQSKAPVFFLPCPGGFVGSDILAGIIATSLSESDSPVALIDLGTNGEIVVGNRERILCASTAAGPAFEGAKISMGMRAITGAISEVCVEDGRLRCGVLGNAAARGICGSGLVDAVAAGLELGLIRADGRLSHGSTLEITEAVRLTQRDIRELQLAKGAITTGLILLAKESGIDLSELHTVYLAGAFGNYINLSSAQRIGLLPVPEDIVVASGNTALLGAKLALFNPEQTRAGFNDLVSSIEHVSLNDQPDFQDVFVEQLHFPSKENFSYERPLQTA